MIYFFIDFHRISSLSKYGDQGHKIVSLTSFVYTFMFNSMAIVQDPSPLVITMEMRRGVSKFWLVPEVEKLLISPFSVLLLRDVNVNARCG